jgi:hypothetical protein
MFPQIQVNFVAVIVAVIASFVLGFIWHGPLFGKVWMKLMNIPEGPQPSAASMIKPIAVNLVGTFLLAFVMVYSIEIWRPSIWKIARPDEAFYFYGFMAGVFNWLGFMVPMLLIGVAWEKRSWKLFGFNAAYHLANSLLIAMILAAWPR